MKLSDIINYTLMVIATGAVWFFVGALASEQLLKWILS